MKICFVTNSYPNESNPSASSIPYFHSQYFPGTILHIAKRVESKKANVPNHVVLKEISYKDKQTPVNVRDELHTSTQRTFFQMILTHLKIIKTLRSVVFFLKSVPALIAFKPQIIACHQNLTVFHGVFAKIFLGSKFILHLHNNAEVEVIKNLWLLRRLVEKADAIFCLSPQMSEMLEDVAPHVANKIWYTTNGIDPTVFKTMDLDRKNQLVAVGSFKWMKGYKFLLNAMPRVISHHPEYSLIIIGDGEEKEAIIKQISTLKLSDKVMLMGIVPSQHVAKILNESKVFVMSSLREGLPRVLIEALACGTPAVITTECNADNLIESRGLLVEAGDSDAIAEAILKLIEDKLLWREYSSNAKTISQTHTWEKISNQVYEDYLRILKSQCQ